ncbi:Nicotinate phosphoribosyltransferase 2 [Camellia lanceoleosa]|uniref:Nicotinate phosphoribosyltransferase 2 n=1 Tax=Camellia lanceoleosa TaxID=1840588 RepID=A0ACC0GEF9_9ERIC|nr:Nicotinate phosphoribosyltransferase 2 [Camellia lanceoleosa]
MSPDEIMEKSLQTRDGSSTCEDFVSLVQTWLSKIKLLAKHKSKNSKSGGSIYNIVIVVRSPCNRIALPSLVCPDQISSKESKSKTKSANHHKSANPRRSSYTNSSRMHPPIAGQQHSFIHQCSSHKTKIKTAANTRAIHQPQEQLRNQIIYSHTNQNQTPKQNKTEQIYSPNSQATNNVAATTVPMSI